MIAFGVIAGVMVVLAVAALVPFLLRQRRIRAGAASDTRAVYRERLAELEAEHERGNLAAAGFAEARDELEREVLADADRIAALAVAIGVPVAAVSLYALTGQPGLIGATSAQQLSEQAVQRYRQMAPGERIGPLQDYVENNPDAPRAWQLLGQAYRAQEQFGDAFSAFQRARDAGDTSDGALIARQAEALLLANGRDFTASVKRLIDEALEAEPRNPLGLLLAGHAALSEGRNDDAIRHWSTLKESMPDGDRRRQQVERLLARARGNTDATAARERTGSDTGGGRVTVEVSLDPNLREQTGGDTPVFVFARSAQGGGPPLAVARTTVGALPARIALTDDQAMMDGRTISQAARVVITARASSSGSVEPQPGDLEGQSDPVEVARGSSTDVVIDRRIE
ncbi:MAG: c-type cytochrome biogenesis protein CcmI [Proteobacteria bacterium SW_6_67_9]|nr:MAG: c-type cytochrome biogenesis protein CcmI [Proteobacteria bacterium SW_6_67_9]